VQESVLVKAEKIAEVARLKVEREMSENPEKKKKDLARLRLALARKLKGKDYHACEKLNREIESIDCCIKGGDLAPHMDVDVKYLGDDGWHLISAVVRHDMLDGTFAVAYDEDVSFCRGCMLKNNTNGACFRDRHKKNSDGTSKIPDVVHKSNIISAEDKQLMTAKQVLKRLNALVQAIELQLVRLVLTDCGPRL
jgi:hypothetical protein